jgi:type I restriction enzyme M protein
MINATSPTATKQYNTGQNDLESAIWNVASTLRGSIDAHDYKDYMLGFVFYKFLSDKIETWFADNKSSDATIAQLEKTKNIQIAYADLPSLLENGDLSHKQYTELWLAIQAYGLDELGYYLEPKLTLSYLSKQYESNKQTDIIDKLQAAFAQIESSNQSNQVTDLQGLFASIDMHSQKLASSYSLRSQMLGDILLKVRNIQELENTRIDSMGLVYEYLIKYFASSSGKKAGEFYTPPAVSKLLTRLVFHNKKNIQKIYDPACGSGSLLVHINSMGILTPDQLSRLEYYGQEKNFVTYNMCRMNVFIHGIPMQNCHIAVGDTLIDDKHTGTQFDIIVANPPFSIEWRPDLLQNDTRFTHMGGLAPQKTGDYAFVQHMLSHLDEDGHMGVIAPHGLLFRGGPEKGEGRIRQAMLNANYIDAVIGLPSNIFYGTGIPTCILLFKKCRPTTDILFIDAKTIFRKEGSKNVIDDTHIDQIMELFEKRTDIPGLSAVVSSATIAENNGVLSIERYVLKPETTEPVDLAVTQQKIQVLQAAQTESQKILAQYCQELGIPTPF